MIEELSFLGLGETPAQRLLRLSGKGKTKLTTIALIAAAGLGAVLLVRRMRRRAA